MQTWAKKKNQRKKGKKIHFAIEMLWGSTINLQNIQLIISFGDLDQKLDFTNANKKSWKKEEICGWVFKNFNIIFKVGW